MHDAESNLHSHENIYTDRKYMENCEYSDWGILYICLCEEERNILYFYISVYVKKKEKRKQLNKQTNEQTMKRYRLLTPLVKSWLTSISRILDFLTFRPSSVPRQANSRSTFWTLPVLSRITSPEIRVTTPFILISITVTNRIQR